MISLDQYDNVSFDRGASRIKELCWRLIQIPIFRWTLPVPSTLRNATLRFFGAQVGRGVVIRSGVNITFPWRLKIGDHVWIGEDVTILSLERVEINDHCCISQQAFLCTGSHDFSKPNFDLIVKPIRVERGCWIAARAFVGPGVTFATNSMCAAGTVVVRDVPPCVLVAGNPASIVRQLKSS